MRKDNYEETEFDNVICGLERANIRLYQFSLLLIYPKGPWRYYNYVVLALTEIVGVYFLITGVLSIYLQLDDMFVAFESAHAYIILLAILCNFNDFHFFRKTRILWYKMLNLCKDDFHAYNCEEVKREMKRLRSLSKNIMKWFFNLTIPGIIVNLFMIMVVIPLARYFFNTEQRTTDTSFNIYFPVSIWCPFNSRTIAGFSFMYTLMIFIACNLVVIFLVYIATVLYFFMELIIQLRILCFALGKHEERALVLMNEARRTRSDQFCNGNIDKIDEICTTENLKEIIIHHMAISEFFNTLQEFSSFFFGLVLSANMLLIVAMSILLTRIDSFLTIDACKFILLLIIEILHIFSYSYCGSLLMEEALKVQRCLYSMDWYGFNSNQKKILNIFQVQSASNFLLMAAGLYEINLDTFLQVMQTAYSVFNIFNNFD